MVGAHLAVSVVIVSYRRPDLLRRCLDAIEHDPPTEPFEVIVVDNDPRSSATELVEREFPSVRLIAAGANLGFARAANLGASAAHGGHLLFLNPDAFVHPLAIEQLLAAARAQPALGIFGGLTVTETGDVQPTCIWAAPTLWSTVCFGLGLSTMFPGSPRFNPEAMPDRTRTARSSVDVITGCFLLATQAAWRSLGGFDEAFWLYGEDTDLCLRAERMGYQPTFVPDAVATHLVAASSEGREDLALLLRAKTHLLRKHFSPASAATGIALLQIGTALRALSGRMLLANDPERHVAASAWACAWQERRSWRRGFCPPDSVPCRPIWRQLSQK